MKETFDFEDERPEKEPIVPVVDKYLLTVKEAASYFNIGRKRMRRLAEDGLGKYAVYSGNRYLIIRPKLEELIVNSKNI